MAELTDVADVAADIAEEAAEGAEYMAEVSKALDMRLVVTVGLGGLVVGFALGGLYMNKRIRVHYEKMAEEEIAEMREHFRQRLVAKEEKPDLGGEADKISEREGYSGPQLAPKIEEDDEDEGIPPEEETEPRDAADAGLDVPEEEESEASSEVRNAFEDDTSKQGWDYEEEIRLRRPDRPYIVNVDEIGEKPEYTEVALTLYDDDVVADEHDKPVEDVDKVVGLSNLEKFGHGSGDPNILFVRNDLMELNIELDRDNRSYSEVVHGIKHSADLPRHKGRHRFDDDET